MKNMNDDYLWDQTGEPDPEIQQLEQVLGTLRYQPRPLNIPAGLAPDRKRSSLPRLLAIAATIAIMLLGVGLWFGLQRTQTGEVVKGERKPVTTGGDIQVIALRPKPESNPTPVSPPTGRSEKRIHYRVNPGALSREPAKSRRPTLNTPELTAAERKEAEAAKEQLILALRVASSKLNFAQKKAQEINSQNLVHNQHKIG